MNVPGGDRLWPLVNRGAALHFFEVNLLEVFRFTVLEQVIVSGNDADADDVIVQGDIPKPTLFPLRLQHECRPGVLARFAFRAFPIRPDRRLL